MGYQDFLRRVMEDTNISQSYKDGLSRQPTIFEIGSYEAGVLYDREDKARKWLTSKGHKRNGYKAFADLDDGLETRQFGRLLLEAPQGRPGNETNRVLRGIKKHLNN